MTATSFSTVSQVLKQRKGLLIFAPWLVYALYLIIIASPQYESQSQLIVKSSDSSSSFDPSALMLSSVSGTSLSNESQLVEAYIKSADMLFYLEENLALREHYRSDNADFFSALSPYNSKEDFLEYYLSHIDVSVDAASSVITLRTRGFTPEFAQKINQAIVQKAEDFINKINNDLAKSKLRFATSEHEMVEQKLQQAKTELLEFQSKYNVLDPTAEGAAFQQIAFSLEATLAQKRAELSTIGTMMSDSAPEVINIRRQIKALESQLKEQKARISELNQSGDNLSVSELMARYSNVKVELELAIQAYASSLMSLENTRVETYQQLQHLVTVESPTLPEDNQYPRTLYNLTLFGVVLLMLYGVIRIIIATIKEL